MRAIKKSGSSPCARNPHPHGTCLGDVAMLSCSVALLEHLAAAGDKDGDVFVALLPEVSLAIHPGYRRQALTAPSLVAD